MGITVKRLPCGGMAEYNVHSLEFASNENIFQLLEYSLSLPDHTMLVKKVHGDPTGRWGDNVSSPYLLNKQALQDPCHGFNVRHFTPIKLSLHQPINRRPGKILDVVPECNGVPFSRSLNIICPSLTDPAPGP
jgi:hypothetical protein